MSGLALILEDTATDAEVILSALRRCRAPWSLRAATTLDIARKMLADETYAICFADYCVPGGHSLVLAKEYPDMTFVLVTLETNLQREFDWTENEGVAMVLRKPACAWKVRQALPHLVS